MKRENEPEEDIMEEEEMLKDANDQLELAEKDLNQVVLMHQQKFQEEKEGDGPNWDEYERVHVRSE